MPIFARLCHDTYIVAQNKNVWYNIGIQKKHSEVVMNVLFNAILSFLNAGLMVYIFMLFFSAFAAPRFSPTVRALLSAGIIAVFTVL